MTTGSTTNDQRTTTYGISYLHGSALVASITNNLGFGISKYYADDRNLITCISNYFGNANVSSFEYVNDALGRRSQRLDFDDNLLVKTNTFAYNRYQEIDESDMGTNEYSYIYDNLGNRCTNVINGTSVEYADEGGNLNQYIETYSADSEYDRSFEFDLDGNMTELKTWTSPSVTWQYTWDAENRMSSATNTQDGTYITYNYDYQGRMVQKIVNSETNHFVWMGTHIIAEMSDSSTNTYTWLDGETITASLDGETVFYAHDANKNVTDLVDDSGSSLAHYEYSPFGVITEQTGTLASANLFRFSNEVFDDDLQTVVYLYRIYDPWLNKFLSRDPIEESGGLNLYAICGNDSINRFDLWGLKEYDFSIYLGVGAAAGNRTIANTAKMMKNALLKYKPPKDACNDCRVTIVDRVKSSALREASKEYDIIHFYGHGYKDDKIDPDNKNRWIRRTKLGFSDGKAHLSDVFTLEPEVVATEYMKPWICYDKYVDLDNKSQIEIIPPMNKGTPNSSFVMFRKLNQEIIAKLKEKKCCDLE